LLFDGERFAAIAREIAETLRVGVAAGVAIHAGRDVFVAARLEVKGELVVDVADGPRAEEGEIASPARVEARRHLAHPGRSADVMTVVTALVKLDHVDASVASASRPLAVIS